MKLTPLTLIVFRVVNVTLGRAPVFGRWMKRVLTRRMITTAERPYGQCAGFFEFDQLKGAAGSESKDER